MSVQTPERPTAHKATVAGFAHQFAELTEHASHNYEVTVHKLLVSLQEYHAQGALSDSEYDSIIGTAADVMHHFNLTPKTLASSDAWYRASVIHQMGQGMLQCVRNIREDLTLDAPYQDALDGLAVGRNAEAYLHVKSGASPIKCHQWAGPKVQPKKYLNSPDPAATAEVRKR